MSRRSPDEALPSITLDLILSEYENTGTTLSFFTMEEVSHPLNSLRLVSTLVKNCITNYPWTDPWVHHSSKEPLNKQTNRKSISLVHNPRLWNLCFPYARSAVPGPTVQDFSLFQDVPYLTIKGLSGIRDASVSSFSKALYLNLDSFCFNVSDHGLNSLKTPLKLNISSFCNVTDKGLQTFVPSLDLQYPGIQALTLPITGNFTDKAFSYLSSVKQLNCILQTDNDEFCSNITDQAFEYIPDVEVLNLSGYGVRKVTGSGFHHFKKIKVLALVHLNQSFRLDYLSTLGSLRELYLDNCKGIVDDNLKSLPISNLEVLDIQLCSLVTDLGLSYIAGVPKLNIGELPLITDLGFQYIGPYVEVLIMTKLNNITDLGLSYLTSIRALDLGHMTHSAITMTSAPFFHKFEQTPENCCLSFRWGKFPNLQDLDCYAWQLRDTYSNPCYCNELFFMWEYSFCRTKVFPDPETIIS